MIVWSVVTEYTVSANICTDDVIFLLDRSKGLQCNMQDTVECRSLYKAGLGTVCVCVCRAWERVVL